MEYEIPLATTYGKSNKNGLMYSEETIMNAYNDSQFHELLERGLLSITTESKYSDLKSFLTIDPQTILGKIKSLNINEQLAKVDLKNELDDIDKYCLGMRMLGKIDKDTNEITNIKIVSYNLISIHNKI